MRTWRILALATCGLLVSGCSATKLAYNNLESLASWQIGKFVDLGGPSEEIYRASFTPLWTWHRHTQLPLYVADLRELQQAIAEPLTAEQIESLIQRSQNHVDRLVRHALPDGVRVIKALDDEQIAGLRKRMEKSRAKRAAKLADLTAEEARGESLERLQKSLKRWLGSLDPAQKTLTETWVAGTRSDVNLDLAASREWGEAFDALLLDRAAPDLEPRLERLVLTRELETQRAVQEMYDHNQSTAMAMLAQITQTLTERQRQHFRAELEELAGDLELLARQGRP